MSAAAVGGLTAAGIAASAASTVGAVAAGAGALASAGVAAYNAANAPNTSITTAGGLQIDIGAFLDGLIAENPEIFKPFDELALVNPQSPLGALVAADIAVQLGRDPVNIGKGPAVSIINPITGERTLLRLPGATKSKERKAFSEAAASVAAAAREGRFAAIERVAELQQNFPVATPEEMDQRIRLVQGIRDQETESDFQRAAADLLERSNLGGFSPSAGLGLLAEERSQRDRQNDLDSIGVALALLQGEQQQAVTGLTALQNSLNSPTDRGIQLAGIESSGLSALGAQAASQANAIRQGRNANLQAALGLLGQQQNNAAQQAAANDINAFNARAQFGQALGGIADSPLAFKALSNPGTNNQNLTATQLAGLGQLAQQNRSFNFSGAPDPLKVVPGGVNFFGPPA
jgi:hypothetical protein